VRTTLWRCHLGGGRALALAYVYLPFPPRGSRPWWRRAWPPSRPPGLGAAVWSPARRLPFYLFAAGEAVGFVGGSLGSSAAVTRAGGSMAAAALICVAYLIGIAGYALLTRARSPGRDHAGLGRPA
jgi:hypothetical protein